MYFIQVVFLLHCEDQWGTSPQINKCRSLNDLNKAHLTQLKEENQYFSLMLHTLLDVQYFQLVNAYSIRMNGNGRINLHYLQAKDLIKREKQLCVSRPTTAFFLSHRQKVFLRQIVLKICFKIKNSLFSAPNLPPYGHRRESCDSNT